ncbi:amino acid transporter [Cryptococcus wingfieldii CBS 7118]|uniref:Amino acid transporter n=1 Tax=Cryptococcus wingfieldii CBS 7118 TaxID=1295528 RepID=A0A1E3JWZ2_9TREE|nr:amino acid transporter [Cryptococcus wingfieldii CBS 7118]ODO05313.1 amino acid transporter [Cryptococcus wingfieldii CBS 7118]
MSLEDKEHKSFDASEPAEEAYVAEVVSEHIATDLTNDPHRGLRMRHVQLIAISGSVGSALFVSIGNPLTSAGPLGLLIGVALWSLVVWAASNCLIEMTTLLPLDGGFVKLSGRFVDWALGMAVGWNYVITQWALICFELTSINVIVQYWKDDLNPAILISACLVLLFLINVWSVRWFGEIEFYISIAKLILIVGLTLYTFITMVGGNPLKDVYGFRFWKTPGPFAGEVNFRKVITGIFDSISWATFAVVGPDYISLVGGEVKNPRRILPKAFNSTVYRILGFYITGCLCVGIVSSSTDQSLLGAISGGAPGAAKSPYVISMNRLGIPVLPSIVNALVLISLFSTANSFTFVASRSVFSLAQQGQAPKVFLRTNRHGVPYVAVTATLLIGCLAYLSVSSGTARVLNWWIDLVTAAQLVSWTVIAITYLRFRSGLKAQNLLNNDFLPIRGYLQPLSGWYLLVWSPIVLLFSGYYCFLPGAFTAADFVFAYGSVFIFLAILIGAKIYAYFVRKDRQLVIPADQIDFKSDLDHIEELTRASEEKRLAKSRGAGEKVSDFFF